MDLNLDKCKYATHFPKALAHATRPCTGSDELGVTVKTTNGGTNKRRKDVNELNLHLFPLSATLLLIGTAAERSPTSITHDEGGSQCRVGRRHAPNAAVIPNTFHCWSSDQRTSGAVGRRINGLIRYNGDAALTNNSH